MLKIILRRCKKKFFLKIDPFILSLIIIHSQYLNIIYPTILHFFRYL
jgi:hypothetical protein